MTQSLKPSHNPGSFRDRKWKELVTRFVLEYIAGRPSYQVDTANGSNSTVSPNFEDYGVDIDITITDANQFVVLDGWITAGGTVGEAVGLTIVRTTGGVETDLFTFGNPFAQIPTGATANYGHQVVGNMVDEPGIGAHNFKLQWKSLGGANVTSQRGYLRGVVHRK